ncbi:MAG: CPBP family intramembrane metalloprotease [Moorea sp. SIO2B7]|nr:CPBP family intramembrane metalloprotease [Moorena sp. SIO2B7]
MTIFNLQANQWLSSLIAAAAVVKLLVFFVTWAVLWLPISIPLAKRLKWHPAKPSTVKQKLPLLASLYLVVPLIIWVVTEVEGLSFADYGLEWQPHIFGSLLLGLGLGIVGLLLVFGIESLLGWIQWHPENRQRLWSILLPILGLGLWVGITEELIFRGFLINELQQDYFIWIAAAISSVIFALLHLIWEQKETIPQLPGLWLMGMVLVGARLADGGSLGLAWGLHAGWIWGLSCLDSAELISYTGKGSEWFTGLGKQPLAGLAGILCLLATGAVLWLFSNYNGLSFNPYES